MRTVYTPGFFLNGSEWKWRRAESSDLQRRAKAKASAASVRGGNLVLKVDRDHQSASVRWDAPVRVSGAAVVVAVLGFGLSTKVKRGENAGTTLEHDFVALATATQSLTTGDDDRGDASGSSASGSGGGDSTAYTATVDLPSADDDGVTASCERLAIVAWVQSGEHPRPLQAVGGWWSR